MSCTNNDCDHCPFRRDPYDQDRWVCIKCGKEHRFQRFEWGQFLTLALMALLVAALIDHMVMLYHPGPVPPNRDQAFGSRYVTTNRHMPPGC